MAERYTTPEQGTLDWHVPLNENFSRLETDVEIRDLENNIDNYTPTSGRLFRATDSGNLYLANGTDWNLHNPPSSGDGSSYSGGIWTSITEFGAVGDGSTDDSDALEKAIHSATNVYVPDRTFKIQRPLTFSDVDTLHLFGPGTLKYGNLNEDYKYLLRFNNSHDVTVENLTLDGNYDNTADYGALFFDECTDTRIDKCDLYDWGNAQASTESSSVTDQPHTITARGCQGTDVLFNNIRNSGGKGVNVWAKSTTKPSVSTRLIGNRTYNTGEEGLFAGTTNDEGTAGIILANNDIDTTRAQYGIRMGGKQRCHALIANNTIRNTVNAGIEVKTQAPCVYNISNNVLYGDNGINMRSIDEPLSGVISNNTLVNCSGWQGIKLLSGCEDVIVSGNYVNFIRINSGNNFSVFGNYTYGKGIDTSGASGVKTGLNI